MPPTRRTTRRKAPKRPAFPPYYPKREISGVEKPSQRKANEDGAVLSIWQSSDMPEIPPKQRVNRRTERRTTSGLITGAICALTLVLACVGIAVVIGLVLLVSAALDWRRV